jgi:hypothetical protein
MPTETAEDDIAPSVAAAADNPGLIAVFAGERPCCRVFPLTGRGLGREELTAAGIDDARVSRSHVLVEREGDRWCVRDLGSRNGTYVHGRPAQVVRHAAPVIRVGRTLLIATRDCRPFAAPGVVVRGDAILGPTLQAVHARVAATAASRAHLLIQGESGTGKELAARAYHAASGAEQRPFVAVNCATIPRELAERILFGARKGVYTGAVSDAVGLVQAADRGTLFLDEIAELDLGVQSKLLRVIETGSVTMLGGVAPVAVDVRVCAATLRNLRAEVAAGRFREDLYFRIGRPEVRLPPLRERREEIPWLVARRSPLRTSTTRPAARCSRPRPRPCRMRPTSGRRTTSTRSSRLCAPSTATSPAPPSAWRSPAPACVGPSRAMASTSARSARAEPGAGATRVPRRDAP